MRLTVPLLAAAMLVLARPPQSLPPDVSAFLGASGFSAADLGALEAGQVIVRVEAGTVNTELAVLAAVKIRAPRASVVAYYGQMVSWVDGQVTLAFGRFSDPPSLQDVKTLELDREDLAALRGCKPGKCGMRLGAKGADAIGTAIDWSAPDADARVQQLARQSVVDYVTAYKARGDDALITYTDASKPVQLAAQWRELLAGSPAFYQYQPALRDYLTQYPKGTLAGARDILYWVKEDFGMKPTISVVHAVIYDAPGKPDRTTIVQKQIYASHYYDASLAVATLIDGTAQGQSATYMIYGNRSRGDLLKGGFGGVKRAVARDQARKAAQTTLGNMRDALEKRAPI